MTTLTAIRSSKSTKPREPPLPPQYATRCPRTLSKSLPQKGQDLKAVERAMIEKALSTARFIKSQAAKLLGLARAQLYAKLRRHGLN